MLPFFCYYKSPGVNIEGRLEPPNMLQICLYHPSFSTSFFRPYPRTHEGGGYRDMGGRVCGRWGDLSSKSARVVTIPYVISTASGYAS